MGWEGGRSGSDGGDICGRNSGGGEERNRGLARRIRSIGAGDQTRPEGWTSEGSGGAWGANPVGGGEGDGGGGVAS